MNTYYLTEGVIWKKLLGFFFPILFGTLFQQLYNTADAVIVGKFVGTEGLAAVGGSAAQIINLVIGFFTGMSSGATVVIAQHYGARDEGAVSRAVHTSLCLAVISGAVVSALCIVFAPQFLRLVNERDELLSLSVPYLRWYFTGAIPLLIFNIGSGIFRALGDSRHPLYYLIFCCVLNIGLDLLCVCVFNMGAAGAALATAIAQTLSAALILLQLARASGPEPGGFIRKKSTAMLQLARASGPERFSFGKLRISRSAMRRILYVGLPSGIQSGMYSLSNLILQVVVNSFGTTVIAAWTATGKIDGVFWATSTAFGMAICAFVGQNYGARLYDRARKSVRVCLGIELATTAVYSALILSTARWTLRALSDDTAVISQAIALLWRFVPYYAMWVFIEIYSNALRGTGDSVAPTVIIMLGVCVMRILWVVAVIPRHRTIDCVALSYPVSWVITAAAISAYYFRSRKKNRAGARAA